MSLLHKGPVAPVTQAADRMVRLLARTVHGATLGLPSFDMRTRITLLSCAIGVLTAALLGALAYHRSGEIALKTAQVALSGETHVSAQRLDARLSDIGDDLVLVARLPDIASLIRALENDGVDPLSDRRSANIESRLGKTFGAVMLSQPAYRSIELTGIWGTRIVGMTREDARLQIDKNTRAWTNDAPDWVRSSSTSLRPGNVEVSTFEADGRTLGRFVTPVTHSGSTVALLGVTVDLDAFLTPLFRDPDSQFGVFAIDTGGRSRLVAGSMPPIGDILSGDDARRFDRSIVIGSSASFDPPDSPEQVFMSAIPPRGWLHGTRFGTASLVDRESLIAPAVKARSDTLLMVGALLLVSTTLSMLFARIVTQPLGDLTQIVRSTQDAQGLGDLPLDRPDEIGDLSRAVNSLGERLSQAESHANAVLQGIDDGVVTFDTSGQILTANPAARKMFPDARPGASVAAILPIPDAILSGSQEERHCDFSIEAVKGAPRHYSATFGHGASDVRGFATVVLRDVSADREVEIIKERFIATVSHELRTPLTAIKASLVLLKHEMTHVADEKMGKMITLALSNTQRLSRLVDDILSMEKARAGRLEYYFTAVELNGALGSFMDAQGSLADAHGVSFQFVPNDEDLTVHVDLDRLEQVVLNLLSNAAKFSPAGTTVTVSVDRFGDTAARISVSDRGPGIASDFRDTIFQPFVGEDNTHDNVQAGTGLGLNIARTMAHAMNAQIDFDTAEGRGTTFHVTLPLSV